MSDHVVEWSAGPVKNITKGILSVAERANVPNVSSHVFRHSAAVHMAESGVPMGGISQYFGHSNAAIGFQIIGGNHRRGVVDRGKFGLVIGADQIGSGAH